MVYWLIFCLFASKWNYHKIFDTVHFFESEQICIFSKGPFHYFLHCIVPNVCIRTLNTFLLQYDVFNISYFCWHINFVPYFSHTSHFLMTGSNHVRPVTRTSVPVAASSDHPHLRSGMDPVRIYIFKTSSIS